MAVASCRLAPSQLAVQEIAAGCGGSPVVWPTQTRPPSFWSIRRLPSRRRTHRLGSQSSRLGFGPRPCSGRQTRRTGAGGWRGSCRRGGRCGLRGAPGGRRFRPSVPPGRAQVPDGVSEEGTVRRHAQPGPPSSPASSAGRGRMGGGGVFGLRAGPVATRPGLHGATPRAAHWGLIGGSGRHVADVVAPMPAGRP